MGGFWPTIMITHTISALSAPHATTQVAADALSAIDRMECTVNDVLDFRKLDANLFTMSPKAVDLSTLLDRVCRHCRPFLLPSVGLQYRVVPPGAYLMLDPRRVHQIIINGLRWAAVKRVQGAAFVIRLRLPSMLTDN
jgi:signal transduction histidine kinase